VSRFAGRAAIVTGASSGIGRAIAERLAGEGAAVCLVAAPADADDLGAVAAALERAGARAVAFTADVGDPETGERAVAETVRAFGRLDVLAANAGIACFEHVLEKPVAVFDETFRVNVRGIFLCAQAAGRAMAADGGGAIVCTASSASFVGDEFQVSYNASKGAVASLARSLAVDLAPYGIRVNAVAPGWVRTRVTEAIIADPGVWSRHRSRIPLDRAAEPAELAAVAAFLASDDASYVTGAVLVADGGMLAGLRASDWAAVERDPAPRPRTAWTAALGE
jgi:NAD(P)-dependent dehydrogenase (short-subunit alcohol dehydrogenase family)